MFQLAGIGSLARYTDFEQVGEGTYGYVYRAIDRAATSDGDKLVALKKLIIHKETSGFPMCSVREIKFLKSLSHKNIVTLKDIVTSKGCEHLETSMKTSSLNKAKQGKLDEEAQGLENNGPGAQDSHSQSTNQESCQLQLRRCGNLYLVFEYIEHDLGGLVDSKYKFPLVAIKSITKQLFDVLDYLSQKKVLHRDIKSSNILISNYHLVKLADFGLARTITNAEGREGLIDLTNNVITMWYKPPELLLGSQRYSYSIDIWSVGCVLAELELGRPLFPGKTEVEQLDLIFKCIGTPNEQSWSEMASLPLHKSMTKDGAMSKYLNTSLRIMYQNRLTDSVIEFLERILVPDPNKRLSAKLALTNKFFRSDPIPPDNPMDLPPLQLAEGASFHEYETKKNRKVKEEETKRLKSAVSIISADAQKNPPLTNASVSVPLQTQQISMEIDRISKAANANTDSKNIEVIMSNSSGRQQSLLHAAANKQAQYSSFNQFSKNDSIPPVKADSTETQLFQGRVNNDHGYVSSSSIHTTLDKYRSDIYEPFNQTQGSYYTAPNNQTTMQPIIVPNIPYLNESMVNVTAIGSHYVPVVPVARGSHNMRPEQRFPNGSSQLDVISQQQYQQRFNDASSHYPPPPPPPFPRTPQGSTSDNSINPGYVAGTHHSRFNRKRSHPD